MSSCRAIGRCFGIVSHRRFHSSTAFCVIVACALLVLAGCSPKTITSKGGSQQPFVVVQEPEKGYPAPSPVPGQRTGTVYLPADDGKPLTKAEEEAFLSEGEIDRNLTQEQLADVLLHFKYFVHQDRSTVEQNIHRAELYMPYIYNTLRSRGLPRELAYIAFIESGYNPKATSSSGASGMWQFISSTGKHYGMEQDWWMDERRDPYQSTRAAADYLDKLHRMFNDWQLAITAYNAGEGKIQRGLAATGSRTFFELRNKNDQIYNVRDRLSDENKQYLPKFIAVCKIARNLNKLGFSSMNMSRAPQIAEVKAKPGTDLLLFSRSMGLNWETFVAHNPAYQRNVSHPSRPTTIYVPKQMAAQAQAMLFKLPPANTGTSNPGLREYTIARGDTMVSVSRKTGVPVAELRRLNQVSEPLRPGRSLKIPGNNASPADSRLIAAASSPDRSSPSRASTNDTRAPQKNTATVAHEVRQGDTMYSIAKRYGVSPEVIISSNNLKNRHVTPGQELRIPGGTAVASAGKPAQQTSAAPARPDQPRNEEKTKGPRTMAETRTPGKQDSKAGNKIVQYKVQSGDTMWAIARKFNVSPIELLSLNNMSKNVSLRPGDTVRVAVN